MPELLKQRYDEVRRVGPLQLEAMRPRFFAKQLKFLRVRLIF